MSRNELDHCISITNTALLKSAVKINKWLENFMPEVLLLCLTIPGRINFLRLECCGSLGGQCYRQAVRE